MCMSVWSKKKKEETKNNNTHSYIHTQTRNSFTERDKEKTKGPNQEKFYIYQTEKGELTYSQLICCLCEKGIYSNDWLQNSSTENKPAPKRCYEEKKNQLATQDDKEVS
jgi:hypothetical protein